MPIEENSRVNARRHRKSPMFISVVDSSTKIYCESAGDYFTVGDPQPKSVYALLGNPSAICSEIADRSFSSAISFFILIFDFSLMFRKELFYFDSFFFYYYYFTKPVSINQYHSSLYPSSFWSDKICNHPAEKTNQDHERKVSDSFYLHN